MIIYDGLTGIHDVSIQNDTALISTLIPDSPAVKAGIKLRDQLITINDSVVSGTGLNRKGIMQLIRDRSGKVIELKIRREEEILLSFTFQRDPYLYQIDSYDYVYLVDSLEQWDIHHIMSPKLDTLYKDPLKSKITVYAVEEGSPAERNGILPGDQIIRLAEEQKDGMDMAMVIIDKEKKELQFAGAQNPLYLIRNSKQFTEEAAGLKEPLERQNELLEDTLENWRADMEQIDDICVIGVRI